MVDGNTEGYLIARSDGPGTGRFIGRALRDSLDQRRAMVGFAIVRLGGRSAIDLLFARDGGEATEVVRCHLDAEDRPQACEVWRLERAAPHDTLDSEALAKLLETDDHVQFLRASDGGIALQTASGTGAGFPSRGPGVS